MTIAKKNRINFWGDINPGNSYKDILEQAQRMSPKNYPKKSPGDFRHINKRIIYEKDR